MVLRLRHPWLPAGVPGMLIAMLALVSQLALGAIVLPDEAAAQEQSVATLDALTIPCNSATPPTPDQVPRHHRHCPDCALRPLCVALALPAAILTPGPEMPLPAGRMVDRTALPPPARGPPLQPRQTPPSRGPPVLS